MGGDRVDFFVSYASVDRPWAEWVAWQLLEAGYTVELDVWDWAPGRNFVTAMNDALDRAARVVALFSAAYFYRSRYTTEEWSASVAHVRGGNPGRLTPVRVEEVGAEQVPAVLRPLIACDWYAVTRLSRVVSRRKEVTALRLSVGRGWSPNYTRAATNSATRAKTLYVIENAMGATNGHFPGKQTSRDLKT